MKATLIATEALTHDTHLLHFRVDSPLTFVPGQFVMLTVQLRNNGNFIVREGTNLQQKRAFSISSSPTLSDHEFELTIKREPEGLVSRFLTEVISVGETFECTGPYGKFVFSDDVVHAVLIAAGSGIAPMRSMMYYIVDKKLKTQVDLLYSNKTTEDIAHEEELIALSRHENISVQLTVTRPNESQKDWSGTTGRIDIPMIAEVMRDDSQFYLCGPPQMVKDIRAKLLAMGIAESRVKIEAW